MFKLFIFCLLPMLISCAVNWEDCGKADRSLVVRKLNFKGENLLIDGKNPIQVELDFSLLDPLSMEVTLKTELRRYFKVFGIQSSVLLPCINGVGSCSDIFCYFVDYNQPIARSFASQLKIPYDCLMKPGRYAGNITYPVPLDGFRPLLKTFSWAASGKYELVMRWYLNDDEIGCLAVSSEVEINL